jgi:hypothetical protein
MRVHEELVRRRRGLTPDEYEPEGKRAGDELGATLILALVFLTAVSLLVVGLLDWSGNDLSNVRHFVQTRTLDYAANSAMNTAISSVRYSPNAGPSSGLSILVPNPNSANNMTMDIWCSPQPETEGSGASSRLVTLDECWDVSFQQHTCSASSPYLEAVVSYDDYTNAVPGGQVISYPAGQLCTTSCGSSMTVKSWVFG